MTLTDKTLKNIKITGKRYEIPDRLGLSVRISPTGKIVFQYRYRIEGFSKRKDYGAYPIISLAEARKLHQRDREKVQKGFDPHLEAIKTKWKRINEPTVSEFCQEYYERYLQRELKRPEKPMGLLKRDIIPQIGKLKVSDVSRRDLVKILDRIVDRGARIQANRTSSAIRGFFDFAVARGIIEATKNPAIALKRKLVGGTENSRSRYLSFDEIKLFWKVLDDPPFGRSIALVIKLLLLTGVRVGELTGAKKEELDYKNRLWEIPIERIKTVKKGEIAKPYKVHLSDFTIQIFKELEAVSESLAKGTPFVVQSSARINFQPMYYAAPGKAILREFVIHDLRIEEMPKIGFQQKEKHPAFKDSEPWRIHDLRRTLNTHLSELGVEPYIIEKILNHKLQGILGVYNQAEYLSQRAKALDLWAKKIKQCVYGNDKIIEFPYQKQLRT
jgi:integrase